MAHFLTASRQHCANQVVADPHRGRFASAVNILFQIGLCQLLPKDREGSNGNLVMADHQEGKKRKGSPELELFDDLFPTLVDDLTKNGLKDEEISAAVEWFKAVLEYNVPFGKKNRGIAVVESYRLLAQNEVTEENLRIARAVGWCVELLQAFFLVADDVMDSSITRRGQPCWYKCKGVGMEAINDAFYLENAVYVLLKRYCKGKDHYVNLVELFRETTMQTITGQCLDMKAAPESDEVNFTHYTLPKYEAIVKWKTAFYSFYLPVACAMYLAEISDEEAHLNAKTILLKMGEYFQIQDDYLDCYGDPAVTGKIGTDIEDNKCSWLIVQALQRASPEQRTVLQNNYAQRDPEKVATVKQIFADLNLTQVFFEYEERSYGELIELIDKFSGKLPKEMFTRFAEKIYKRRK